MRWPLDRTMLTLASLACSARGRYSPESGQQFASVEVDGSGSRRVEWEILPAELDQLEAEGWIELLPPDSDDPADQAKIRVTHKGDYWLLKWLKKNHRKIEPLLQKHAPGARPDLEIEVTSVR